jgi:protein-disulfide isomerase
MRLSGIIVLLFSVTFGCTKKNANQVPFESPFQFVYDSSLAGTDFAAQLDKDQITWSQLLSPSPALLDLEERINIIIIKHVHAQAGEDAEILFAFEEPKQGIDKVLGLKSKKDLKITFDPKWTGGIAKAGEKVFTVKEISEGDMLLSRLMMDRFQQSMQSLEGLFARRKILEASKAANVPMEQYIQEKILKNQLSVTDADVEAFAQKNFLTEKELTEELRAQIKDTILSLRRDKIVNSYVGENLVKTPIRVAFRKPEMRLAMPEMASSVPQAGQGPINVFIFTRWNCETCGDTLKGLTQFVSSYQKYFKLSFLFNFPANSGEERMTAEAALCLKKQSDDLFWKFLENFDVKSQPTVEESINTAAKSAGADFESFRTCFLAREFKEQVDQQIQATQSFGFYRTPVVVLDGKVLENPSMDEFVNQALDLKAEKGLGFNLFYKLKKMFGN